MKTMTKMILAATVAISSLTAATAANAATFLVTYNVGAVAFNATVTTTDTANANGFFAVTGLTGTRGGQTVSLLPTGSIGYNDNLIKPTAEYLTANGLSYSVGTAGYNPYLASVGVYTECGGSTVNCTVSSAIQNFRVTAVTSAVPETATWGLMIAGFGMMGAAVRTRQRSTKVSFA